MKKICISFLLLVSSEILADQGRIEAQWSTEKDWNNSNVEVQWVPKTNWQTNMEATLSIEKNGLGIEATIDDDGFLLNELFVDISTDNADWTIGRKPQEWSYAFYESQLNWIQDQSMIMREQYLPFGSWQTLCLDGTQSFCAMRLSGWLAQADWQMQAAYGTHAQLAAGVQIPFGLGGLLFGEIYWNEKESTKQLTTIAPFTALVGTEQTEMTQLNLGVQWSTGFNLTIQAESMLRNQGLDSDDWKTILDQIGTPNAGLASDAFEAPFGRSSHLLRLAQAWQNFDFELVNIYWPDADNSWLHELNLGYELNDRIDLGASWQHAQEGSALGRIGMQNNVAFTLSFKDGFSVAR
jgi:hypothetical protein